MSEEYSLELFLEGRKFKIYWLNMSQSCDFTPFYDSMNIKERKKLNSLIVQTGDQGPGHNREKWNSLETGLFEMKSGKNRVPFFYHEKIKDAIVITHIFVKKQNKCPAGELERARKRREIANQMMPTQAIGR